ncbi:MAG: hypothetical protein V4549_17955 [Bacteroidota bacterium]
MKKSWKTTVFGLLTILPMVIHTLFPEMLSLEQSASLSTLLAGLGLTLSKDAGVTGGTRPATMEAENRTPEVK